MLISDTSGFSADPNLIAAGANLQTKSRHRGANQFLEGGLAELFSFANVDGSARVPFETGVEKLVRVPERSASEEGELDDLLEMFFDAAALFGIRFAFINGVLPPTLQYHFIAEAYSE